MRKIKNLQKSRKWGVGKGMKKRFVMLALIGSCQLGGSTIFEQHGILMAQSVSQAVKGKVVDMKGEGIPGVNIIVKGTTTGTSTDIEGAFELNNVQPRAQLVVSFIGYKPQEINVDGRSELMVTLEEDIAQLNEVVVTALGIERSAKTLTYSTQTISGSKLADVRDANFVNTLSGKVAGAVITQGSGGPGSATRVVLRGNRSIQGNNNALFVVDGVPIDNSVRGQATSDFGAVNGSDGASNINPDDIESMSVLKGAAAAALYGSRAANGVIMITTKKGKAGKLSADINSGVSFESPFLLPKLQQTYGQGVGGESKPSVTTSWGAPAQTYANNIPDFFRTAVSTNNAIGISSGTEKTQTYLSYANNYNQGILSNNSLMRHTMNLRINSQLTNKLSVDSKITYINQAIKNKSHNGETGTEIMNLYKTPTSIDLHGQYSRFEDESGNPTYWGNSGIYMNPYWSINRMYSNENRNRVTALGSAKYDLTDWLNIQARLSYDWYSDLNDFSVSDKTLYYAGNGGSYSVYSSQQLERNLDLIISGNNKINDDFAITYNAGAGNTYTKYQLNGTASSGLAIPNRFDLAFATQKTLSSEFYQKELQYVFGTASLSFREYLTVDGSIRNDWSSTLPKPYSFLYSSAGANFIATNAMELPNWISFLKVRGSWAQVGNDADPYRLQQLYIYNQGGYNGFLSRSTERPADNLKPEISTSTEFGIDFRVFGGRLGLDATVYNSNTVNQLLWLPMPTATGFSGQYINAGKINNKGFELTLNGTPVKKNDFTWDVTLNMARNVNKIIELHENVKTATLGGTTRSTMAIVREGGSYGDLQAIDWKRDDQGNLVVNSQGLPVATPFDNVIGNFNPKLTLGLNNSFNYKNFVMSVLVDGRIGGTMVSGTQGNMAYDGTPDYTEQYRDGGWVLDAVVQNADGTISEERNTTPIDAETFWQTVSQERISWGGVFAYNTTNFRVRELSFGYNIPMGNVKFIKNARVSVTARNLFFLYRGKALTDIPGLKDRKLPFDPDVNLSAANYQGLEYGNLPSTRSLGINLKLGF
jgi:TonB-linked SusC/RagA family outer membrane protein